MYRLIAQGTVEELKYERQSTSSYLASLTAVHKQQRSRQLNQGTFERRIHQGYEGGRTEEEQGELFGTQNIFRFDPNGFVPGNVSLTLVSLTTSSRGSARQKTSSLKISSTRNTTRTRSPAPMTIPRCVVSESTR